MMSHDIMKIKFLTKADHISIAIQYYKTCHILWNSHQCNSKLNTYQQYVTEHKQDPLMMGGKDKRSPLCDFIHTNLTLELPVREGYFLEKMTVSNKLINDEN